MKVGQAVQYFDLRANTLKRGQVLEMRRKEVVVLDLQDAVRWVLSYAAINLDGADVQIREQKPQGLGRNEVALGDVVGFVDRDQQQRTGKIIRLNDKTVTLQCDRAQWRVAYSFLHRVVDVDGMVQEKFSTRTNYRVAPLVAPQVHKPYVVSSVKFGGHGQVRLCRV